MTILGGAATLSGPVVGAFIVLAMFNYLTGFGSWVTVIQGLSSSCVFSHFAMGLSVSCETGWRSAGGPLETNGIGALTIRSHEWFLVHVCSGDHGLMSGR